MRTFLSIHYLSYSILMELPVAIIDAIITLGRRNMKEDCANSLIMFLKEHYLQCGEDYKRTSTNERYSTGKLEKKIFIKLADICHWENGNDNAKQAGDIMIMLGYMSYKERPNRFRQKVENGKKKKRNGKLQRRRRRTGKRRFRYDISSSEESYSDYERISEPDVKSESDNRENPFFDIPSPSNVEVFNDVVVGFTDNSLTNVFSDPVFREYPMDDFPRMFSVESEMQDFQGYSDELI